MNRLYLYTVSGVDPSGKVHAVCVEYNWDRVDYSRDGDLVRFLQQTAPSVLRRCGAEPPFSVAIEPIEVSNV